MSGREEEEVITCEVKPYGNLFRTTNLKGSFSLGLSDESQNCVSTIYLSGSEFFGKEYRSREEFHAR